MDTTANTRTPDPNGRQLDGMGGGLSSLSKVCVVGTSKREDADVDYTFAAIGVRDDEVDFSSNCGNMTSAIGPFAIDSGLVRKELGETKTTVRICNTNTGKIIHSTFAVSPGDNEAVADGDFMIDGVAGTAARIELAFLDPAGSKTGKLLPTGNVIDMFDGIAATCIDAGNPCVFVSTTGPGSIDVSGTILPEAMETFPRLLPKLESIRRQAAVAMGICKDEASTPGSIPKIAIVSPARTNEIISGATIDEKDIDLVVRALSVGQPHRALPVTVGMALAAAANVKGSLVHGLVPEARADEHGITLGHPSGKLLVGAKFDEQGITAATVFSTARRLFDGNVYWKE